LGYCQLAAVVVTGVLANGAGGFFLPAFTVPAAQAAEAHLATARARGTMIAEVRVTIFNVYPASGPAGAEVTLTGSGFTADNTIYFGPGAIAHVPITSSIGIACTADPNCRSGIKQMLVFTVPSELPPACPPQPARCSRLPRETAPGEYRVRVENENGKSNELPFTVTGGTAEGPHQQ
jgi:IPT/TIG domain-containing protein